MIAPGILVLKPLQAAPEIKSMVLSYFLRSKYDPRSSEVNAIVIREMGDSKNTPRVLGFKLEGGEKITSNGNDSETPILWPKPPRTHTCGFIHWEHT